MKCQWITAEVDEDRLKVVVKFLTADDQYRIEEMWVEDYKGDTPAQLADSFQMWVDHLRGIEVD